MGLISRVLELEGIATTIVTWHYATKLTAPARLAVVRLNRGSTLGEPNKPEQQRRVLEAALALLAQDAPVEPITLDERPKDDEGS